MIKKGIILSFLVFCSTNLLAQNIYLGSYNHIEIEEDFNSKNAIFPLSTTIDNYFIVDNGDFFLNRNNATSEYALFTKGNIEFSNFRLKTSIKLGPSSSSSTQGGVVLKAQRDGSGAVVVDINSKGQYRLRQLINGKNKFLSGSKKKNGWVKSTHLKGVDELNFIDIVTENGDYELYINHEFVTTVTLPEYKSGSIGLIVGPEAKLRVDYFYVYSTGTAESITYSSGNNERIKELERVLTEKNISYDKLNSDKNAIEKKLATISSEKGALELLGEEHQIEVAELNSRVLALEKEKSELEEVATVLDQEINTLFSSKKTAQIEKGELQKNINQLEIENTTLNNRLSSLNVQIKDLESSLENEQAAGIQMNGLREQIKSLESERTELAKKVSQIQLKNAELDAKNTSNEQSISNLNNQNDQLTNSVNALKSEKNKLNSETQNLLSNNKSVTQKNTSLQEKLQTLENEVIRLESAVETVNFDLLQKVIDYESISNEASEKEKELISLKEYSSSLKEKVAHLESTIKTVSSNLSQETADLRAEKSQTKQLNETIEALNTSQKNSEVNRQEQLQKVAALNQSNGILKVEIQNLKKERTDLLVKANTLKVTAEALSKAESDKLLINNDLNELKLALKTNKEKLSKLNLLHQQESDKLIHSLATNDQLKQVNDKLNTKLSEKELSLIEKDKIISSLAMKKQSREEELAIASKNLSTTSSELEKTQEKLINTELNLSEAQTANNKLTGEYLALKTQYEKQKDISKNFANSYRLENEKNKQLEKEIAFTNSSIASNTSRSEKTIFRVQLGTFGQSMDIDGLGEVTSIPTQGGKYIYLSGKFNSYSDAKVRLLKAMDLGYRDAFIVKF